jgi:aminopeptidase N
MEQYREALLKKNENGVPTLEAGPVTLGIRLYSSEFPDGYDTISYGRGTWLFRMLHSMFRDAETLQKKSPASSENGSGEDLFFRTLRKICQQYAGRQMTNADVERAFEENLPVSLRFEGKQSLSWFFDEWVNGTAIPKIEFSNLKFTPERTGTLVTGTILQKEAPPELVTSVPLYAVITDKKQPILVARVFADGNETAFRIKAPAGTRKLLIDPYQTVLTRK